jgi:LL-diaminopimelate aminotransferase
MPFKRSERLDKLPPYLFAEMERKKAELVAAGKDIINLGIGDPDQNPPDILLDALRDCLDEPRIHQYSSSQGSDYFREGVARWMNKRYGVSLDPKTEITLLVGAKEGVAHLPLAVTNPGDVVMFTEPGYPAYRSGTVFASAEPYELPLTVDNNFFPDFSTVPAEILDRAKLLFINYPNNPTGQMATKEFFEEVVALAKKHDFIVCHDAAYNEIWFDENNKPISFLEIEGARDVGIEYHSMTKTFNMAGWRIAWACGHPEVIEALRGLRANYDSGQHMAMQKATVKVLDDGDVAMKSVRDLYQSRRDVLAEGLRNAGWDVTVPDATLYIWTAPPEGYSAMEFASYLLEEAAVVVTPGVGFGPSGDGFVRFALTVTEDRLREAVGRIAELNLQATAGS